MRCRNCGFELEAQDRLRNGAYRCPQCGTIHHTASSSRRSPSPWRRHKSAVSRKENPLLVRYFGYPLWSYLAAVLALVLIVVVIVLMVRGGASKPKDGLDAPAAPEVPATSATAEANVGEIEGGQATPEATAPSLSTGVALNDFLVSFDWAMDALDFKDRLTLVDTQTAADGSIIQSYTFSDWYDLKLTLAADGVTILEATSTGRLPEGSPNNLRVHKAFVSELYGFDNTINAVDCRSEVEAMIADNSRAYGKTNFTARITNGEGGMSYELNVRGLLNS